MLATYGVVKSKLSRLGKRNAHRAQAVTCSCFVAFRRRLHQSKSADVPSAVASQNAAKDSSQW